MFLRLMWKLPWLGLSPFVEGNCYILTAHHYSVRGKMSCFYWASCDLPWDSRGFNAWEILQNSRRPNQLTVMKNSFFLFKNIGNML